MITRNRLEELFEQDDKGVIYEYNKGEIKEIDLNKYYDFDIDANGMVYLCTDDFNYGVYMRNLFESKEEAQKIMDFVLPPICYSCFGKYLGQLTTRKKLSNKQLKKLYCFASPNDFVINIVERKSYNKKTDTMTTKTRIFKFTKLYEDKWVWWEVK